MRAETRGWVEVTDSGPLPPIAETEPELPQMSVMGSAETVIGVGSGGSGVPSSVSTVTVVRWPSESVTITVAPVTQMVGLLAATVKRPGFAEVWDGVTKIDGLLLTAV